MKCLEIVENWDWDYREFDLFDDVYLYPQYGWIWIDENQAYNSIYIGHGYGSHKAKSLISQFE